MFFELGAAIALLTYLVMASAPAQAVSSTFSGTVRDCLGNPAGSATLQSRIGLTDTTTNQTYYTNVNPDGTFNMSIPNAVASW
jgi:hypothetical protein